MLRIRPRLRAADDLAAHAIFTVRRRATLLRRAAHLQPDRPRCFHQQCRGGTVGVCRRRRPTDRPTALPAVVPLTAVGVRRSVFGGGAASGNGRLHPRANGSRSRLLGELWERVAAAVRSQQQRRCTGRCDSPAAAGQGVQLIDQQGIGATKLPTAALRALWLRGLYVVPLPRSCECDG
jgi:hypothetical protein